VLARPLERGLRLRTILLAHLREHRRFDELLFERLLADPVGIDAAPVVGQQAVDVRARVRVRPEVRQQLLLRLIDRVRPDLPDAAGA